MQTIRFAATCLTNKALKLEPCVRCLSHRKLFRKIPVIVIKAKCSAGEFKIGNPRKVMVTAKKEQRA